MAGKRNKLKRARYKPKQPDKCKRCEWGNWTGTKQFCSRPKCQKEVKSSLMSKLIISEQSIILWEV